MSAEELTSGAHEVGKEHVIEELTKVVGALLEVPKLEVPAKVEGVRGWAMGDDNMLMKQIPTVR